MEKMKLHSQDVVSENIGKLAELFPQCFVECKDKDGKLTRKIDWEMLQQELSGAVVDGSQERYTLNWPGKREAILLANSPIAKTLRPCRKESVDFDNTQNLYIEGDNLDVLKLLRDTYLGKVKMIYIDPPYNTGNDFIYEDDFAEDSESYFTRSNQTNDQGGRLVASLESNGRYHSDWLTMIYPRLRLAHQLLRDDGVIFISIDDNEVANLRKVCDEVFGAENLLCSVIWQKIHSIKNDAKYFSDNHEYVIAYAKSLSFVNVKLLPRSAEMDERYKNPDSDPRGPWQSGDLVASGERTNGHFIITSPCTGKKFDVPEDKHWVYSEANLKKLVEDNQIWFGIDGNSFPRKKRFLSEVQAGQTPSTLWLSNEVGHNQSAARELKAIFGDQKIFDFPKPVDLVKRAVHLSTESDNLCLDFFSGSAVTAHAVMQLNAEDGGNRQFIMVQLPEVCAADSEAAKAGYKNICEIGKERIRRAGAKIKAEWEAKQTNPESDLFAKGCDYPTLDIGFRVLKLDSSNMENVYYTPDATTQDTLAGIIDNVKSDRTAEDLLFQVMLDWGVELSSPITVKRLNRKTVYFVDTDAIAACFDIGIDDNIVRLIADHHVLRAVFRDNGFATDATKINVVEIFKQLSPATEVKVI